MLLDRNAKHPLYYWLVGNKLTSVGEENGLINKIHDVLFLNIIFGRIRGYKKVVRDDMKYIISTHLAENCCVQEGLVMLTDYCNNKFGRYFFQAVLGTKYQQQKRSNQKVYKNTQKFKKN